MIKKKRFYHKVIAIDFDGTLSLGKFPSCGPENKNLTCLLRDILKSPVFERPLFALWTSRGGEDLDNALAWLSKIGIVFDAVNESPKKSHFGYTRKIQAALYIDDRAIDPNSFVSLVKTQGLEVWQRRNTYE
jgi:hypothetical protein